jgi:hypothetical protein
VNAKPRVVVLGGGFAGLETAYMLRMKLHDAIDLSVVSDRDVPVQAEHHLHPVRGGEAIVKGVPRTRAAGSAPASPKCRSGTLATASKHPSGKAIRAYISADLHSGPKYRTSCQNDVRSR